MAEDDKYVPSEGNYKLDPTDPVFAEDPRVLQRYVMFKGLAAEKELFDLENEKANRKFQADRKAAFDEEYETDSDGTVRTKGYWQTKGGQATAKTRAARAHITERTWGKYNRGETQDMYGKRKATPMRQAQIQPPKKKSDIHKSMSPTYGQITLGKFGETAAGPVASGLLPWISRFNPSVCGPMRVAAFNNYGGVIQSNAQEAANNGFPINLEDTWGKA